VTTEPTETEDGVMLYRCNNCPETKTEKILATGHIQHNLEKIDERAATEEAPGNKAYWKCISCGKIFLDENGNVETTEEEVIIPKINHKEPVTEPQTEVNSTGKNNDQQAADNVIKLLNALKPNSDISDQAAVEAARKAWSVLLQIR